MTNRLCKLLRKISLTLWLSLGVLSVRDVSAQPGFFTFMYNGPDTVAVGPECTLTLESAISPQPTVTTTNGTVTVSAFNPVLSGFPITETFAAGETAHIFWHVENSAGQQHDFEFFVSFADRTAPVFDLTGIADTLYLPSVVQVPPVPNIPVSDNCNLRALQFSESPRPDTCLAGTFTRTWMISDSSGNKATFRQHIVIAADVTPPTITFPPQNGTARCELLSTAYPAWRAAQIAAFTVQDPSGIKSVTNNAPLSFPPGCTVPLTVVFRATDNCDLSISTTAVFNTSDTKPPVILVPPRDSVVYCNASGDHLTKLSHWVRNRAYMQVIDSCSGPLTYTMKINGNTVDSAAVIAAFNASLGNACDTRQVGNQQVNKVTAFVSVDYFVADACGNQIFAGNADFAAVDTLPPTLSGSDFNEQCGGSNDQVNLQLWINIKGNAVISDNCSLAAWTNYTYTTSDGQTGSGNFNSGPYPVVAPNVCNWFADVTFNAADECGNAGKIKLRFRIIDTQAPVISGLAPKITVFCPNPLPTVPAATITDNCDVTPAISFTRVYQDSLCAGNYTVMVTWMVTDDCGNTATALQEIAVRDTTRPVFTLVPEPYTAQCDTFELPMAPVTGTDIQASDVCSPVSGITTAVTSFRDPNPAVCGHYTYNILRVFTATDQCGNSSTSTQLISVVDTKPPVPAGLLDTTALCSNLVPFPLPTPGALDACSGLTLPPVSLGTTSLPATCPGNYTIEVRWRAQDVCLNQTQFVQLVHVIDTVAPLLTNIPEDITVECNNIPQPPSTATFNGADLCSPAVTVSLSETEIRDMDTESCEHWTNWTLKREWTATDGCGNGRTYTQLIHIRDTGAPEITLPTTLTLGNEQGLCGRNIVIPAPLSVLDDCTGLLNSVVLRDTQLVTPLLNAGPPDVPVDTVIIDFITPNTPPAAPAVTSIALSVFLDRMDADLPTEHFRIYGENGVLLGITSPTPGQCSVSPGVTVLSITANQFNQWAADGILRLILAPNGTGNQAINPVCAGARVRAQVSYSYSTPQVPVSLDYSVDGGNIQSFPPAGTTYLGAGSHTIVYGATDCAGNRSTTSLQVIINDTEPPLITPPPAQTVYVGATCEATFNLPFPGVDENCLMPGTISESTTYLPLHFDEQPDAGVIPDEETLSFSGLIPNASGQGILTIRFKGDNANPREYFNIFSGTTWLGRTSLSQPSGSCSDTVVSTITLTDAQINAIAQSGSTAFRAVPNTDPGSPFDFDFINPCAAPGSDRTDGLSFIQASLAYHFATVNYTVTNNAGNTVVATGTLFGNQTSVTLSPGNYTIQYSTTDAAGLTGTASWQLTVRDTIRPVAACKPSVFVSVNPSGVNNFILQPSAVNNGSTDNCTSALSFQLSQSVFTCGQAGNSYTVILTATDNSGNTSTCLTQVSVNTTPPAPSYDPVCLGDTLFLRANAPSGLFAYQWQHVNFTSGLKDPVRPNMSSAFEGIYTLTIRGVTGCTSSASVTVNITPLNVPNISVSGGIGNFNSFCTDQDVVLGTATVPGNNVRYQWFLNTQPSPVLIATTTLPSHTIIQPPAGQYQYFVRVKIGDCITPNSIVATVTVSQRPSASVTDDKIVVCEGSTVALGTSVSGSGILYNWSGPGNFSSSSQFPVVTNSATSSVAGEYTLCIADQTSGCISNPCAYVNVLVNYSPPQPQISGTLNICVGDDAIMTAMLTGQTTQYEWERNGVFFSAAPQNQITLSDMTLSDCANWRVRAQYQTCFSPWSVPVNVCPTPYPFISASSNSPICADSVLSLQATSSIQNLSWCWQFPNNTFVYQEDITVPSGMSGTYTVIAKNGLAACADTDTVVVQVSIPPTIEGITVDAPACADGVSDACLLPVISGGTMPFTYIWSRQGSPIASSLSLCFPDVTASSNGPYTFVVKDARGCPSPAGSVTLSVQSQVVTPVLQISPNPVCAGGDVIVRVTNSGSYSASSEFRWLLPSGDTIVTTVPQLVLQGVTAVHAGSYRVQVVEGVCRSVNSNTETLEVNPVPAPPVLTSNQPVCEGSSLQLNATFTSGALYFWGGPSGFQSFIFNPVRTAVSPADGGEYYAYISLNGCLSDTATLPVSVAALPQQPVIVNNGPAAVCLEQVPLEGSLAVSPATQTPGALYTWLNPAGDTLAGPSVATVLNFSALPSGSLSPGVNQFRVIAWRSGGTPGFGCSSMISATFSVRFDTIPNNFANVVADHPACASAAVTLVATPPSGGVTGKWRQLSGPAVPVVNSDSPNAQFAGMAGNTYQFVWSLSSGGCRDFSQDTLTIVVSPPETANAGTDLFTCDGQDVELNATQGQFSSGIWSQLGQFGVTITDPNEPTSPLTGLNPANRYFFTWTLEDIGCGAASDQVMVDYYSVKPTITGDEFVCTGQNQTNISASAIQSWEQGVWSSETGKLVFSPPMASATTVSGLVPGKNVIYWTINNGICGDNSRDTFTIYYEIFPQANPDEVEVDFGTEAPFSVLGNDILPTDLPDLLITIQPLNGTVTQGTAPGSFIYRPNSGFTGEDQLTYKICNINCANACSSTTVKFRVAQPEKCKIPTIITPNDDGKNDEFILGEECYINGEGEDNIITVSIFNQWGDEVFRSDSYPRPLESGHWDGSYNGKKLPPGTYYYLIQFNQQKPLSGFILLQP
jgi:gliding motility-associated-like protein